MTHDQSYPRLGQDASPVLEAREGRRPVESTESPHGSATALVPMGKQEIQSCNRCFACRPCCRCHNGKMLVSRRVVSAPSHSRVPSARSPLLRGGDENQALHPSDLVWRSFAPPSNALDSIGKITSPCALQGSSFGTWRNH